MASSIDATKPVQGSATTLSVRNNFSAAKSEIEALQAATATATTTSEGIVELATQAEVNTGTDTARVVTCETLAGKAASETMAGVIEIATQAEVNTGTDDARAVTPDKVAGLTKFFLRFEDDSGTAYTPPASSSSTGTKGSVAIHASGSPIYICIDTDTWIRFPVTTSF